MPETTQNYHRIPVSTGHSKHRLRTITISDAKQIRAIYCGKCKKVVTYLFSTGRWTMATAKKWIEEHEDGGKAMGLDAVLIDNEEVLIEDLIDAYKAREDIAGDDTSLKAVTKKEGDGEHPASHYLVVVDPKKVTTWHLRVKDVEGSLDHRLMGAAWAALHGGYRGNKYEGPDKQKAIAKLKKLYKQEDMDLPGKKALELQELEWRVRSAWYDDFVEKPKYPDEYISKPRVRVFDEFVIVEADDGLYKYSYTVASDGHGEISFSEAVKVTMDFPPVAEKKSFDKPLDFCIKRLGETDTGWYIGGYGMIWGNEKQRDLSPWPNTDGTMGEFFTPQTRGLDDLPTKVITFEHDKEVGPDDKPFKHVLGTTILERDDVIGRWVEALVEKRRKYADYVVDLIDRKLLNFSSETASHWREVADNGEIKMWRTAGYTTTTHPMEPRLTDVNRLKAYYKSLDLDLAEPEPSGADEQSGLEVEKALSEIELLLVDIEMEGNK